MLGPMSRWPSAVSNEQQLAGIPVDTLKRFSYQSSMSAAQRLKLPPPMNLPNFDELFNTGTPGT